MIRIPLQEDNAIFLIPRWAELGTPAQIALLAILLLAPIILVVCLYRTELRLVPLKTATFLLSLRLILVLLLAVVIGFQPVAAHFSTHCEKSLVLVAVDRSASMDIADPQPKNKTILTRTETARKILAGDGFDLLGTLAKNHEVRLVGFHQTIWDAKNIADLFQPPKAAPPIAGTNLDLPLTRALGTAGRLKGVIVLTDGQHNVGPSPMVKARELARARVPIYPVALGNLSPPPDIALFQVKAPSNLFQEADAAIEAGFKVRALPAQEIHVELWNRKTTKIEDKKTIWHDGLDRVHHVRFEVFLKEPGLHGYEVKVLPGNPATREISEVNNSMPAVIRVSKDKVKVLIVDGEARWEHHYLASALARDRSIALDRVLFVQPRLGRIAETELEKSGNPKLKLPAVVKDGDPLFTYDCIFLGDVSPSQLPVEDRQRLTQFVSQGGGTLIIQSGKRFMPVDYFAKNQGETDPLVGMLPIRAPEIIKPASGFSLVLTPAGNATTFLQLETGPEQNRRRWAEFPNHFWAAAGSPKPGATALAYADDPEAPPTKESREKSKGIIVHHHYGSGQVLYVGVDSTWRWRFKVGDQHHHRFWGQVVRWAAADKLLPAGNQDIRYGGREPVYSAGKPVDIAVRLSGNLKPLPKDGNASVHIIRLDPGDKESVAAKIPLVPNPGQPHILTGQANDLPAGTYRIQLDISHLQGKLPGREKNEGDTFTILPPDQGEMIDLATNWDLLQNLASQTGGEVLTPETVHQLPGLLAKDQVGLEIRQDTKPWQDPPLVWFTLGIFLTLLTTEWAVRKLAGLP
jgi:hypothetical protein